MPTIEEVILQKQRCGLTQDWIIHHFGSVSVFIEFVLKEVEQAHETIEDLRNDVEENSWIE
jgi:hypothetical protein